MRYDAVIIGGGPAGATIGRLLARWGHRVLLFAPPIRNARAESLPPSIVNLFEILEIRHDVGAAGFYADGGNTSWWTSDSPRIEHFTAEAHGLHVERMRFDALLLESARHAGVSVQAQPYTGVEARFTVDCSGRAGVLARQYRIPDKRYRTVAIGAEWTGPFHANPTHTLVEAYETGWAWSVPLSAERRQLCFMLDHGRRRGGVRFANSLEFEKLTHIRRVFGNARQVSEPWASDASPYYASQYAGEGWLLAGDSGSFIDPLSSFGVKKALISAWMGAVVVNTIISRPSMTAHAIQLFNERERQAYADNARLAARHFGERTGEFWTARSTIPPGLQLYDAAHLTRAHEQLRASASLNVRLAAPIETREAPSIAGREVVLHERLFVPAIPPSIEYLQGVHLVHLAQLAPEYGEVPALFDAYNKTNPTVALPNFVSALSFLIACGALIQR